MNTVINVALPVFAVIFVGYLAGKVKLMGPASSDALNTYAYWIAVPALMIFAISRAPIEEIFNGPFLVVFTATTVITWIMATLVGLFAGERSKPVLVMQGMNASFGNIGYMGIPLFVAAFGPENIAPPVLGVVVITTGIIAFVTIMLSLFSQAARSPLAVAADLTGLVLKSPLLISATVGLTLSLTGTKLPISIDRFIDIIAQSASPCALVAIGLFMSNQSLRAGLIEMGWISAIKLIWQPLICWWLIVNFVELDPFWSVSAVILAALPTGTLTFVMAQQHNVYVERTSGAILVSTVLSVISLTILMAAYGPAISDLASP